MNTPRLRIGTFSKDETGALYGSIGGLGLGSTRIIALADESAEGKPFLRLIGDPLGAAFEVGAAFPKEKSGMHYYSVTLDSPLFPEPLNVALFPDREANGNYNLIWNRLEASDAKAKPAPSGLPNHRRSAAFTSTP